MLREVKVEVIPSGEYTTVITAITVQWSRFVANQPYLQVLHSIISGEHDGREIFMCVPIPHWTQSDHEADNRRNSFFGWLLRAGVAYNDISGLTKYEDFEPIFAQIVESRRHNIIKVRIDCFEGKEYNATSHWTMRLV
jgi:hypothetical protein